MNSSGKNSESEFKSKTSHRFSLWVGGFILFVYALYLTVYQFIPAEKVDPRMGSRNKGILTKSQRLAKDSSISGMTSESEAPSAQDKIDLKKSDFDHSHRLWSEILAKHLVVVGSSSKLKYQNLKSHQQDFQRYIKIIEDVGRVSFDSWQLNEKVSFLINAYNAFTVKLILDHFPVKSIKDIDGFFASPWKKKIFFLLGNKRHLDGIQNDLIAKYYPNPNIHFVINSATIGSPMLRRKAYLPEKLEEQVQKQIVTFLHDPIRNKIDVVAKKLYVSKIFKWYQPEFHKKYPKIERFFAQYMTNDLVTSQAIETGLYEIEYFDYNWTLNDYNINYIK